MTLKENLNQLLASGKLNKAIDLLMEKVKNNDQDTYNTIILLKAQYTSNERDNNMGIVSRDDYQRTKARITYAFQQTMDKVAKNLIENTFDENLNQSSAMKNIPTEKEIEGYNSLLKILIDKKLFLEKELITTYDAEKKFALREQIKDLEMQIENYKKNL